MSLLALADDPDATSSSCGGPPANACKGISRQLRAYLSAVPANTTNNTIPDEPFTVSGQTAQDCLQSLPFDPSRAAAFLPELAKYVQFQSTLDVLKNPPGSYASDTVDILGGLQDLGNKTYRSQYDFDLDLQRLFNSAHDAHFKIIPCSLSIFSFQRNNTGIISVSKDGLALPEIYAFADAEKLGNNGNASASPISTINGQDAYQYLENLANTSSSQDPDSRWNELFRSSFWTAGKNIFENGSFVNNDGQWPGANSTIITFRNGSSIQFPTLATVRSEKFLNTTSARDVFNTLCIPDGTPLLSPNRTSDPERAGVPGFPDPIARDPLNEVTGYFLDNDTAVMYVASFGGDEDSNGDIATANYSITFANVAKDIIAKAKASGRTKMIVDISSNGGGSPVRFLNLFTIFFPDISPFDALRLRRSDAVETLVKALGTLNESEAIEEATSLAFRSNIAPDQVTRFDTPASFLGNRTEQGGKVSSLYALNFDSVSTEDDPIQGFGAAANEPVDKTPPFKPDNMLIVGNGFCHSSCAGFVNIMSNLGRVRTLAFGGRPRVGPMQIMGGVRGGQVMEFDRISSLVGRAREIMDNSTSPNRTNNLFSSRQEMELAKSSLPNPLEKLPLMAFGTVNLESTYRKGIEDVPMQFQFQAADCRLFYTLENIKNPMTTWKAAKLATWDGGRCVDRSVGETPTRSNTGRVAELHVHLLMLCGVLAVTL